MVTENNKGEVVITSQGEVAAYLDSTKLIIKRRISTFLRNLSGYILRRINSISRKGFKKKKTSFLSYRTL